MKLLTLVASTLRSAVKNYRGIVFIGHSVIITEELISKAIHKKIKIYRGRDMETCKECYVEHDRITPLLSPFDCLENHTQYICGTCGRCICIERDQNRGLQRWNFPFKSLEIAKLYLRTADFTMKRTCGIYEIKSNNGRLSYKIFADSEKLRVYLRKNKDKSCETMFPVFRVEEYKEYLNTQIRKLTSDEIQRYMSER